MRASMADRSHSPHAGAKGVCGGFRWPFALCLLSSCTQLASATTFFEVLPFREPNQCERMQCLSQRLSYCRDHMEGYYLKEKGCLDGKICTDCAYGNATIATKCYCENPPYSQTALYGQPCNIGTVCSEGDCYRPCHTFLHSTLCPSVHCEWNVNSLACVSKPAEVQLFLWTNATANGYATQGSQIVQSTSAQAYPISFQDFRAVADGYRINGELVDNITTFETMFALLDQNSDGGLSAPEYGQLPDMLSTLASWSAQRRLVEVEREEEEEGRRLTAVSAQVCGAQQKFFCSFDSSCKSDCAQCSWKSAHDRAFSTCVVPTAQTCNADDGKIFCESDGLCKQGNCTTCANRPYIDFAQHVCLAKWWDPVPLTTWSDWVCRYRNKVGMPCYYDQDCIYGSKRCISGTCQPLEPYVADQLCSSDYDCPHIDYYCPSDPTGGENPYWVNYCRRQGTEGTACSDDRECGPKHRCNIVEETPVCRTLFSLRIGQTAAVDELCQYGWRDRNGKCATAARSKNGGGACDSDADCPTTDATGRNGACTCKGWWEEAESKYCLPVAGDYSNHMVKYRNYLWFRVANCGNHWTEDECMDVFGDNARKLKYEFECERQELSGGPFLPPADCGITGDGDGRFVDSCALLAALG